MSSGLEVPTLTIFDHRPRYPLVQEFFEAHDAIGCMHHVIRRVEALEFPNIVEFDPTAPRFHFGADRLVGVGSFPSLWIVWVLCVVVMPQLYLFARVQYSTACRVQ